MSVSYGGNALTNALNQIIYGRPFANNEPDAAFDLLAFSGDVTDDDLVRWRSLVTIKPLPFPDAVDSQALGIFDEPNGDYILVRTHNQKDDVALPVYQYVRLPRAVWQGLAGNLSPLVDMLSKPIPSYSAHHVTIDPLELAPPTTANLDSRRTRIQAALRLVGGGGEGLNRLLMLLNAALDERRLHIRGFSKNYRDRLNLTQGLLMLLPVLARTSLTFVTNATDVAVATPRIIFSDSDDETGRWLFDLSDKAIFIVPTDLPPSPYIDQLSELLHNDLSAFLQSLQRLEVTASRLLPGMGLVDGLQATAIRYRLNQEVTSTDAKPDMQALQDALTHTIPPADEFYPHYVAHLLRHALAQRDTEAARIVAHAIDTHPELNDSLDEIFNAALQDQPDAVYVFVRTRLAEHIDIKWLPRLKLAAMCSLEVAIKDGDTETLSNWLRLISREPAAYELGDVLHEGILAAEPRARTDGALGMQLIMLAVKRDPNILDTLLEDEDLMTALPDEFGQALRDCDAEAIQGLEDSGQEIFLVALARAAQNGISAVFTSAVVESLWSSFISSQSFNLPEAYQPETIISKLITEGANWLLPAAQETLLTVVLANSYDDWFITFASYLSEHIALFPMLVTALQRSGRNVPDILDVMLQLATAGYITPQETVNTYIALLVAWDWHESTLPITEQLARMLQQNGGINMPSPVLWQLLDIAGHNKVEAIARAAMKRLLTEIEAMDDDAIAEMVDSLLNLSKKIQWNSALRHQMMDWWRDYARQQPLVRLQRLDKALDSKRPLEDARTVIRTALALRKMMGQNSLEELAESVTTTFKFLETIADAFDPSARNDSAFDQLTMRAEIAERMNGLTPDESKVLAKNFRELAQLIITLSDNRSKPGVMRSDENFDRQLMTGEQSPQSAIDIMKWLSGYLDGVQASDETE